VDERHLEPEEAPPGRVVDQLSAAGREPRELFAHVVDLEGDVVHAGPALGEKAPHRRLGAERGEQLDPSGADAERCRLDSLLGNRFPVLDLGAEEALVGGHCGVEVGDRNPEVMNAAGAHAATDAIRSPDGGDGCHSSDMRLRMLAAVAAAALVVVGTAGAKTPDQLVSDTLAAAAAAKSVHIVAKGIQSTQPLSFDLHLLAGRGGQGTVQVGKLKFSMIRLGPNAYFKAGADFWRQFGNGVAVQLIQGRWLRASATTGDLASFTPLTDIQTLFGSILSSHGKLKAGGTKTIDGVPAIGVVDTTKSGGGTLWIAAKGTPYPLELTQTGGTGDIRFEDWNKPVSLSSPKNSIDYDKLKKK